MSNSNSSGTVSQEWVALSRHSKLVDSAVLHNNMIEMTSIVVVAVTKVKPVSCP